MGREASQGVAAELADAMAGKLRAEMLGRDFLHRVRLVEHDRVVTRQYSRPRISGRGSPQGQIGEEEVMVDHHHVRLRRLPSHAEDETAVVVLALGPDALLRAGGEVA